MRDTRLPPSPPPSHGYPSSFPAPASGLEAFRKPFPSEEPLNVPVRPAWRIMKDSLAILPER